MDLGRPAEVRGGEKTREEVGDGYGCRGRDLGSNYLGEYRLLCVFLEKELERWELKNVLKVYGLVDYRYQCRGRFLWRVSSQSFDLLKNRVAFLVLFLVENQVFYLVL